MKLHELERMSNPERRRFLRQLGWWLGALGASPALKLASDEAAGGRAWAQTDERTCFIELDLRCQWDLGHIFVAPGFATDSQLRRGASGDQCALFYGPNELKQRSVNGTDVYLTDDSVELDPHLDSIALLDTCEVTVGPVHGHESANPVRSPGRTTTPTAGKLPMFTLDSGGDESPYSSTPTPASLHNYQQKLLDPSLKNGVAFKCAKGGVYHFAAGLPAAELDRHQTLGSLLSAFPDRVEDYNIFATPTQAAALTRVLKRVDERFLSRRNITAAARASHGAVLGEAQGLLYAGEPKVISLPLTTAEAAEWSLGVPSEGAGTLGAEVEVKAQIWEQVAYAFKILAGGAARTVALEYGPVDFHGSRDESLVRQWARQLSRSLARLISNLKTAGLYDRTLIAVFTSDGSRGPESQSYGDTGKNTVLLAGGMVRGGYFGDLRAASNTDTGHVYSYHSPDLTSGVPGTGSTNPNAGRLPSARVWRTVMKALKVPDALCDQFPDVAGAAPLPFMLR